MYMYNYVGKGTKLPLQICFQKFTTATDSCPSAIYMARFDNENGNL